MEGATEVHSSPTKLRLPPHSPEQLRALLADLRAELERLYGPRLKEMLLFGSYARGEATASSDVDVAIVLDDFPQSWDVSKDIGEFRAALCLRYDAVVTLLPFREHEWRARDRTIIRVVAQEGIPLQEVGRQDSRISHPRTRGGPGMNAEAEVNALLARAEEDIRAAHALQREGFFRRAMSSAYYALFYIASALLLSKGESYSSHRETMGAFGRIFARTGELDPKFHRCLLGAFADRNKADYEAMSVLEPERVAEAINWAEEFLEAARDYLSHTDDP